MFKNYHNFITNFLIKNDDYLQFPLVVIKRIRAGMVLFTTRLLYYTAVIDNSENIVNNGYS